MTTDAQLLRRYAETGSQEAFAELVQRHLAFVYAAALRQVGGSSLRAEDIAPRLEAATKGWRDAQSLWQALGV